MENFNYKQSCFFSGHRYIENRSVPELKHMTEKFCVELIEKHGVKSFISGGALGYDTLAAETVIKLKRAHPHIALRLYLPCRDQSSLWRGAQTARWEKLLSAADCVRFIHDGKYFSGCMQARNAAMVQDAYFGIVYCVRRGSGTYSTIQKALEKDRFLCLLPSGECLGKLPGNGAERR